MTYLVIFFNFFATSDNFGVMVRKIQEGWEKSLILGVKALHDGIQLIDWLDWRIDCF